MLLGRLKRPLGEERPHRRSPPVIAGSGAQLPRLAGALGLVLVTGITAPSQVGGRRRSAGYMGFEMVLFSSEPVATIDALDPVELGRFPQLESAADLDRGTAGPAGEVA